MRVTEAEYPMCKRCRGTGMILARLTPEQDLALAKAGQAIPKVDCPTCYGDGFLTAGQPSDQVPPAAI